MTAALIESELRSLAAGGRDIGAIAKTLGVCTKTVRTYAKKHGVQIARKVRTDALLKDQFADPRTMRMATMHRQGLTLQKIADEYGLTRERVRQLITKVGAGRARVDMLDNLKAVKLAQAEAKTAARIYAKWGIARELHQELRANGTIRAFEQQRQSASARGIAFELTFAEWFAIWRASGKFHLRGRGKTGYCMSRIRDDGGYVLGNVHIQSAVENGREAVKQWVGKTKTHKGVFCLYPGRPNPWLARVGKERLGYFPTIESAVAARDAYLAAHPKAGSKVGRGKGWTFMKTSKTRPYMMQCAGFRPSYHATQAEAEAAYRAAVAERQAVAA